MGALIDMRSTFMAAVMLVTGCATSATAPTDPTQPSHSSSVTPANIAGAWADTTDSAGDGVSWALAQHDSLVSGTENDYLRVGSPGATWWTRVEAPASVSGTVHGDTAILAIDFGSSAPVEVDTVVAHGSDTLIDDSADFTRGAWTPDTTAPQGASSHTVADLTGLWVSDSIAWLGTPAACNGAIQSAITISRSIPDDSTIYDGNTYDRMCGSDPGTPWTYEVSNYGQLVPGDCLTGNYNCGNTGVRCLTSDSACTLWYREVAPVAYPAVGGNLVLVLRGDTLWNMTPDSINAAPLGTRYVRMASVPGLPSVSSAVMRRGRMRRPHAGH